MTRALTEAEMRGKLRAEFPEHFRHAWTLFELAQGALGSFKAIADTPFKKSIALIGGRSFKAYHAILNLCEIAYTEDAGVILRSLFQLLVITRWLSMGDSEKRARKYLGWFWVAMMGELKLYESRIDPRLARAARNGYANHKGLFEYIDKDGKQRMSKQWCEPDARNLEQMAKEVDLTTHYDGLYRPLSSVEHSDALAYSAMVSEILTTQDGVSLNLHSDMFVPAHVRNAFQYFGEIFNTWNQTFAVLKEDHVRRVRTEGIDFFKQDMSEKLPTDSPGIA
ncbi:MAG: DUF5677 domain-containing protein [Acidobacteriia bacterium]|nr:DUF5677 domain-containing protein [Terriglobia bacterium]